MYDVIWVLAILHHLFDLCNIDFVSFVFVVRFVDGSDGSLACSIQRNIVRVYMYHSFMISWSSMFSCLYTSVMDDMIVTRLQPPLKSKGTLFSEECTFTIDFMGIVVALC